MRLAVISCWKYRDCWTPFFELLRRFWPDCSLSLHIVTDECRDRAMIPTGVHMHEYAGDWCENLYQFARNNDDEPFLLMQEDFFFNEPVNNSFVELAENLRARFGAGGCRLFPCPPADLPFEGVPFGVVKTSSLYRVNCQASIWDPKFVMAILSRRNHDTTRPNDWELDGTRIAESLPEPVLSALEPAGPAPFSYLCSAISDGKWMPDAKKLCDKFGVSADWSLRDTIAAL